jgi:hypothetical protein
MRREEKRANAIQRTEDAFDIEKLSAQQPDDYKLQELIVYLSKVCESDETYGSVKLNKLLFFADFLSYVERGTSITGQEYAAQQQGPCSRRLLFVRSRLEWAGDLAMDNIAFRGKTQKRPVARREPDTSIFTPDELAFVDRLVDDWWNMTATQMSDTSHRFIGWKLARRGETIPYEVARLEVHRQTEEEVQWGLGLEPIAESYPFGKVG